MRERVLISEMFVTPEVKLPVFLLAPSSDTVMSSTVSASPHPKITMIIERNDNRLPHFNSS